MPTVDCKYFPDHIAKVVDQNSYYVCKHHLPYTEKRRTVNKYVLFEWCFEILWKFKGKLGSLAKSKGCILMGQYLYEQISREGIDSWLLST